MRGRPRIATRNDRLCPDTTLVRSLGNRVVVGAGAKILGPFTVGADARVGSNSVVVKEVPPGATVVGIPARIVHEAAEPSERSEEHTSELQSLMRISYAVFCLKKKKTTYSTT